jgi:flagellar hook assembly protein FlgD
MDARSADEQASSARINALARPAVLIRFGQASRGPVTLRIYDVTGRRVRILDDGLLPPGQFTRTWDGRDDGGRPLPAGVYFARLRTSESVKSEKITLVR